MKTGLILEGGAMRGLFTAGIIDVMMERGIDFDGVIGVSAGAAFGCNFKSRQPGRVIRYNKRFCRDPRYCGWRSLIKTGDLFGGEFCYHELPDRLDLFDRAAYDANPLPFYAVCTDVATGEPVVHRCDDAEESLEWLRASASMPLVSRIVTIDGRGYLDGGISDSVPLRTFEGMGYEKNVVVLTQPADYVKKPNRMMPLFRWRLKAYPRVVAALADRHRAYNQTLAYVRRREAAGAAFVIRPKAALPIGHMCHDAERLEAVYQIGRETAEACLPALKSFMAGQRADVLGK